MNDTEKILHKMRLVSDADAAPLAASLVIKLSHDIANIKYETIFAKIASKRLTQKMLNWKSLIYALRSYLETTSVLSINNTALQNNQKYFHELLEFCIIRQKRLDNIRLTITPRAMRFVPKLTNIDINSIQNTINKYILQNELHESIHFELSSTKSDKYILDCLSAMREAIIQSNIGIAYQDEVTIDILDELEALYGVLLHYFADSKNKNFKPTFSFCAPPHFVYCDKCWRLIPESYANRQMSRCDYHNYITGKSTHSRKAKTVHDALSESNPVFPLETQAILAKLNNVWKPNFSGMEQNTWLAALEILDSNELPQVAYNLAPVWVVCPRVKDFLIQASGEIETPCSILAVLDPHLHDETQKEHDTRKNLHGILAKNIWLYRHEIALAEAWLITYANNYAHKTHGGPRANAGGKRVGAGRPKKMPPTL